MRGRIFTGILIWTPKVWAVRLRTSKLERRQFIQSVLYFSEVYFFGRNRFWVGHVEELAFDPRFKRTKFVEIGERENILDGRTDEKQRGGENSVSI